MNSWFNKEINETINIHLCNDSFTSMHSHEFLELVYVTEGEAVHILNGMKNIISKGDYFILDYNARHSYYKKCKGNFTIINCLFLPEFIDKSLGKCHNFGEVVNNYMLKYSYDIVNISPANYILKDNDGEIYNLLLKIFNEYKNKQSGYLAIMRSLLIEIIILTMRKSTPPVAVCESGLCTQILKYTAEHYEDKNILGIISKKTNVSVSYLSKKFREEMGISFSDYLQKTRIENSCRLLANTDKKITEIAGMSGYSDIKYFNYIFKKHFGITPREYRKRL